VSEVAEKLRRLSRKDNSNDIAKDEEEPFDYLNNTEQ